MTIPYGEDEHPHASLRDVPWFGLRFAANIWLMASRQTLQVYLAGSPSHQDFQLQVSGSTLFTRLGIEFAGILTREDRTFQCDFCGHPYIVRQVGEIQQRRPWRSGARKHYCPTCRADSYQLIKREKARERYWRSHPNPARDSKYRRKTEARELTQPEG